MNITKSTSSFQKAPNVVADIWQAALMGVSYYVPSPLQIRAPQNTAMPNLRLSDSDIRAIIAYFKSNS